jgi:hypothetical protein
MRSIAAAINAHRHFLAAGEPNRHQVNLTLFLPFSPFIGYPETLRQIRVFIQKNVGLGQDLPSVQQQEQRETK